MDWEFDAIGTHWRITAKHAPDAAETKKQITARIEEFDKTYSRFREDSLVWSMSQKPGQYGMPEDADALLSFYWDLYDISGGRVTPLIGMTMEQAGYDKDYSLQVGERTKLLSWDEALERGKDTLTVKQPGVLLDFGAAGKGYLVDIIVHILRRANAEGFVVNAGGDIWVEDGPERVGLEDPFDHTQAIGTIDVAHRAICGSSPTRRAWGKFHHIIDPETLMPEPRVQATWVLADSCMLADGLATALSFVEPEKLKQKFTFEYAMIDSGNLRVSPGFNAELFTHHE